MLMLYRSLKVLVIISTLAESPSGFAQKFKFWGNPDPGFPRFLDPEEGCRYLYSTSYSHLASYFSPWAGAYASTGYYYYCGWTQPSKYFGDLTLYEVECPSSTIYDTVKNTCIGLGTVGRSRKSGQAVLCPVEPDGLVGNPIDALTGIKYQKVSLLGPFHLIYNSYSQSWSVWGADKLVFGESLAIISRPDGAQDLLHKAGEEYQGETGILTHVTSTGDWLYKTRDGQSLTFDAAQGLLKAVTDAEGQAYSLSRTYQDQVETLTISRPGAPDASFKYALSGRLISFTANDHQTSFGYDENSMLVEIQESFPSGKSTRRLIYDDAANPKLLTGLVDERGVRFATWIYDSQGRAIESFHGLGSEVTKISYVSDGKTLVSNSLGRTTELNYVVISGIPHISQIIGEPTADCPSSNSTFTYDSEGLMTSKTDAKGAVTTYTYNDRGLETSRTEASGTPQARTTTTEWDPLNFLPVRIETPTKITIFTYNGQGLELSRKIMAR